MLLQVNLRSIDATDEIGIRGVHCVWSSVTVESLQHKIDRVTTEKQFGLRKLIEIDVKA